MKWAKFEAVLFVNYYYWIFDILSAMKYDDVPKLFPRFSRPPLAAFSKCLLINSNDLLISKQGQIDSRAEQQCSMKQQAS